MIRILVGDALTRLRELPDNSVHCAVTSPPYWGLRDYQTGQWEGGKVECDHQKDRAAGVISSTLGGGKSTTNHQQEAAYRDVCIKCGARRVDQQIGLEESPELYIARLVEVFREVRRVLRKDGTLWLNIGDSYAGSWGNYGARNGTQRSRIAERWHRPGYEDPRQGWDGLPPTAKVAGLKPKDLCMIPARVALALQADGWWLRSDIIWSKPNAMPESVTDRPTKSHEYIFMLTKSANYYYDQDAIREPHKPESLERYEYGLQSSAPEDGFIANGATTGIFKSERMGDHINPIGRNRRSVWTIPTSPFSEAHFATFPPDLVEPMIKAGSSEKGCCGKCGGPWERVTETERIKRTNGGPSPSLAALQRPNGERGLSLTSGLVTNALPVIITTGWHPACACGADTRPCTVLDPFAGSGTTLMVADRLGRDAIGIELNPTYAEMAVTRIRNDAGMFARIEVE